jgi:hypothetical protein
MINLSSTPMLTSSGQMASAGYVYDTGTMSWVPSTASGGSGPSANVNVTNTSLAVTQLGTWTVNTTGLTDAQLRASPVPVSLTSTTVTGTVAISAASLPLPTGAASESTLSLINGKIPAQGQAAMAASLPVVIASNQTGVPVTGTFWQTTQPVSIASMPTTPVTGPLTDTQLRASAVPVSLTSTTITGTVAATQSGTWNIGSITTLPSLAAGSAIIGKVGIDQTTPGTTNKVSIGSDGVVGIGTSLPAGSALIGNVGITGTATTSDTHTTAAAPLSVRLSDGAAFYNASGGAGGNLATAAKGATTAGNPTSENTSADLQSLHVRVTNTTLAATQSGTWNIGSITTLPALVAGSAIVGKVGIDQTTPGTTNKVSIGSDGTVAINAALPAGAATIGAVNINGTVPVSLASTTITGSVAVTGPLTDTQLRASAVPVSLGSTTVSNTVAISAASLPLPTGAASETTLAALNTKVPAQGQALMAASLPVVIASNQSTVPVSLTSTTITGSVAVTGPLTDTQLRASAVPVSLTSTTITGTVAATQSGTWNIGSITTLPSLPAGANTIGNVIVIGQAASGAANAGNPVKIGGVFNTTQPTVTNGQAVDAQSTARGAQIVATGVDTFNVNVSNGSLAVTGPLTDTQLRASAVPVSLSSTTITGSVAVTGPLTDTQLRASAVPVSLTSTTITGTVAATQSGTWNIGSITTLPALVAGSAIIGKVGIDQTTPGTTNKVSIGTDGIVSTKTALTPSAPATASVGVASASAVAANSSRKGLIITNLSNNIVSLGLGATAVLNSGISLSPYGTWSMDEFSFCTSAVNAIAGAAASTISIQEFA